MLGTRHCSRLPCEALLLDTVNGGKTWASLPAPAVSLVPTFTAAPRSAVSTVRFESARNGWLFGPGLWATTDGGKHWAKLSFRCPTDAVSASAVAAASTGNVTLACSNHGYPKPGLSVKLVPVGQRRQNLADDDLLRRRPELSGPGLRLPNHRLPDPLQRRPGHRLRQRTDEDHQRRRNLEGHAHPPDQAGRSRQIAAPGPGSRSTSPACIGSPQCAQRRSTRLTSPHAWWR